MAGKISGARQTPKWLISPLGLATVFPKVPLQVFFTGDSFARFFPA
jgi:hypothetical protein